MEIILKEDIANLGFADEVVKVKPGYARNFLIPQGMAIQATKMALKVHEEKMKQRAKKEEKLIADAKKIAEKLTTAKVKVGAKVGEKGKIFGSVNTVQLADALEKQGYNINRKFIKIRGEAIKAIGTYEAEVKLHRDVSTVFEFDVVAE